MALVLKELLVVLVISAITFALMKPVLAAHIESGEYSRRRNLWLMVSALAFLIPNFWVFLLVAGPLIFWRAKSDPNPGALYLLLMTVIPSIPVPVPMVGMQNLFSMDIYMLLSFTVMTPALLRSRAQDNSGQIKPWMGVDWLVGLYGLTLSIFYVHAQTQSWGVYPSTATESLRRAVVFGFSVFIPYMVFRRTCANRRLVAEMMAMFCLSCVVLAALAIFESSRHWLLYGEFASHWGIYNAPTEYLMRGHSLRAVVTTGHSGALGGLLAIALGFWLYLRRSVSSRMARLFVPFVLLLGLLADYSRGPWLGAACIYFFFVLLGPKPIRGIFSIAGIGVMLALIVSMTPLRDKIVSVVPFLGGTVDSKNIDYRKRLLDTAIPIIEARPWFGDSDALLKMGNLRQNGIIDLVNCYLEVLLNTGFVGLTLFVGFSVIALKRARAIYGRYRQKDPDFAALGLAAMACVLGNLVMLWPSSLGTGGYITYYMLGGVCLAYAYCGGLQVSASRDYANNEPASD